MSEPGPFLMLARMWLRSPGQLGCERKGRSLMRFNGWCRQSGRDSLPLTAEAIERHAAWLRTSFADRPVHSATGDLSDFADWLYEPLVERPDHPINPNKMKGRTVPNLERYQRAGGLAGPMSRQSARTSRALAAIEQRSALRAAEVEGSSFVQAVKLHEIDFLAREAMTGQALLRQWGDTLAGPDLMLAEELRFFTDVARMGKGEILADTITSFCQEGRR